MAIDPGKAQQLRGSDQSADLEDALAARVKDPLWFLARQWQTGEFAAENGGRPTSVTIDWNEFHLNEVVRGGHGEPISLGAPLEYAVERESESDGDSPAWRSEALEYRFEAKTVAHDLAARDYPGRGLDWYHFDLSASRAQATPTATGSRRVTPAGIHVRGAPDPRWWRLESEDEHYESATDPEPNALSMLLPEFFLLDANNWYVIPLPQTAGSVRKLTRVVVVDSFGVPTEIGPAVTSWKQSTWQLYGLSGDDTVLAGQDGRTLFVPNVAVDILHNSDLEEVRFLRDEDANLVWAYERRYRDAAGNTVVNGDARSPAEPDADDGSGLPRFRLRTDTPAHLVPYVPRQVAPANGVVSDMYLRRGRSIESAGSTAPQYRTRIVAESWKLDEHEIPRSGVGVRRIARFARGSDGRSYFWVGRSKDAAEKTPVARVRNDFVER